MSNLLRGKVKATTKSPLNPPLERGDFEKNSSPLERGDFEKNSSSFPRGDFEKNSSSFPRGDFNNYSPPFKKGDFNNYSPPFKKGDFNNYSPPLERGAGGDKKVDSFQVVRKAIATATFLAVLLTYEIAAVNAYLTRQNIAFLPVSIAATESPPVAAELQEILPKIKQETKVPVLLPRDLLITASDNKIYIDGAGTAEGYKIDLAFEENCSEPRCVVGYLSAEKAGKPKEDEFSRELSLTNNIKGYFRPLECDRLCTIPIIGWEYQGVFYRIALKGVGQSPEIEGETLMKMANSAIEAGAR